MPAWGQISSLSEISSVSLEFTYLARWGCRAVNSAFFGNACYTCGAGRAVSIASLSEISSVSLEFTYLARWGCRAVNSACLLKSSHTWPDRHGAELCILLA